MMTHLSSGIGTVTASRRAFLRTTVASAAALSCPAAWLTARALAAKDPAPGTITTVSDHVLIYHGPINVGIVRDGDLALLIDCGDESVSDALRQLGITRVEQLLLTHYHRDQWCGAASFLTTATVGVPAEERDLVANPAPYWNDDNQLYRVYLSYRPDHLMPTEPLPVARVLADGDRFSFGSATIQVISTPGHTDGSISFLVEADGKRTVFSGDCLAQRGKLWDVYSLQRGFARGGQEIGGYHGFMGDRWRLAESLEKIKRLKPDLLVPSHGSPMDDPSGAIDALLADLESCYENYVSISALRHYFPRLFTDYEGRPGQMPIRPGIKPPSCLRHFGTTWMLVSETGGAFVMDVGSPDIVDRLKKMLADGEIKQVEGLWVTHYHFDHTGGIAAFQQTFDCPCYTDLRLADVLTRPTAWRLPCLAPETIRVDQPMRDGQSWKWHEFTMTSHHYPGQTLYHSGLLAEAHDVRMFFVGDSHTMGGLDDYCAPNRNWLGRGVGFEYCLTLVQRLKPTHMFNCHVDDAFTFTPDEIEFMRKKLDEREQMFGRLVAWDHANFGLDPSWVRTDPYRQSARPGDTVHVKVVITNHSASPARFACRAVLPAALGGTATAWLETDARPKEEQACSLSFSLPASVPSGRYVVPVDIRCPDRSLPRFSETIVDVG
jgi:glyoxylase-like metal-dependent hydrolase (beta-lactamase superfamily II)